MSRKCGAHRKLCCHRVADLSNHYLVGVLPKYGSKGGTEGPSGLFIDLYLVDTGDRIFHWIFDCYYINIITVEDPVEYTIPGINQIQVDEKAGRSFSAALRSILRQDPDKIMVGEVRDPVTAQLAVRAALTGHLVLSTLHTNDAPSAIARLVDMDIAPFLVASSVICVIAQRLVRKLCPYCREEIVLSPKACESIGIPVNSTVYRAVGCDACRGTGYRGRSGIYEIMTIDEKTKRMILEGASSGEIRDYAISAGMKTLRDSGIEKVISGSTSLEEVMQATID